MRPGNRYCSLIRENSEKMVARPCWLRSADCENWIMLSVICAIAAEAAPAGFGAPLAFVGMGAPAWFWAATAFSSVAIRSDSSV